MKSRAILVLLLAVICGTSAAVGVSRLRQHNASAAVETISVVVARGDIPRGRILAEDQFELRDWPTALLPKGAIQRTEDAVGRSTAVAIVAGDVISDGKLAPKDSGRGVAALIPPGMRAYTIQTSKTATNVAGFVLPGNRVDVLLTLHGNPNDGTGGGSSTTLLQAVEILAVDQRLDAPAENKVDPKELPKDLQSVTLLVTPRQAGLLDLGSNMGQLTLSLRNLDDKAETHNGPATLASLQLNPEGAKSAIASFFESAAQALARSRAAARVQQRPTTIRTLRGVQPGEIAVGG